MVLVARAIISVNSNTKPTDVRNTTSREVIRSREEGQSVLAKGILGNVDQNVGLLGVVVEVGGGRAYSRTVEGCRELADGFAC